MARAIAFTRVQHYRNNVKSELSDPAEVKHALSNAEQQSS